ELSVAVEHANNFTAGRSDGARAYLDGTTTVTSLTLRGSGGRSLEWGLEVPLVQHSGGSTDGLIDGFHELFGLPDGGRGAAPRDALEYRLVRDGRTVAYVGERRRHLGDLRGWLGYRLADAPGRQSAVRVLVKAPTGRIDDLSGSEGTDLALWWEMHDRRWLEDGGVAVTMMAGVTVTGNHALAGVDRQPLVASGHLGFHYPVSADVSLHAQLDGHSDILDAELPQLAQAAALGTLGATWRWSSTRWLDVSLTEDLTTRSAPDVVFRMAVGSRF
ncbi:MAG: DUF3187 family protein, partial [Pseudomonadota bacterium]